MLRNRIGWMCGMMICAAAALADARLAAAAEAKLEWQTSDDSVGLSRDGQMIWQLHYSKQPGKPYFHPLTVGGSDALTDFRPADHPWHRALWFSWKTINGVLYWEEDAKTGKSPGETEVTSAEVQTLSDNSAHIQLAISYHPPGKPPVLTEQRVLDVSAPAQDGSYHIDWLSTFTAGDSDVVLDRTPIAGEPQGVSYGGYAGLSLRLVPALRQWQFSDSEGVVSQTTKQARWIGFGGPLPNDRQAAIIVLEHPSSFRHPTPWYLIQGMPYFSPAVLYRSPYTLPAGKALTMKYRILLQPAAVDCQAAEQQWQKFAKQ